MKRGANHEKGATASKGTLPSCKKLGSVSYKTVSYSRLLKSKSIPNSATANEPPRRKQRGFLCQSVLDTQSSPFAWIPASAGMTSTAASREE